MQSRRAAPTMPQRSMHLSRGDSILETLPVDDGRGKQHVAVLTSPNEAAESAQPSMAGPETHNLMLSRDAAQQASIRGEVTAGNLTAAESSVDGIHEIHAHASATPSCIKAGSMSDPTRQEGSALTDLTPVQSSSQEHWIAPSPASDQSYAGDSNNTQLDITSSVAVMDASSNSSLVAPLSAYEGNIITPKAGVADRSDPVIHHAHLHLPESRHSKGLQQLWNCVAHTPLTLPSPSSMTGNHSKQDRRQASCEDQSHQRELVTGLTTPAEVTSQSSSAVGSAASEVTERATTHAVRLSAMPTEDAESPHR